MEAAEDNPIHQLKKEGWMMLSSLLLRLAMVALTMTVVCWIAWTLPTPQETEALHTQGNVEAEGSASQPVFLPAPQSPLIPRPHGRIKELPRPMPSALDVNRATEDDFERLPGIGPVLARRIVEYRETRGTFQDVEQLRYIKGIGKKTFERIRDLIAVVPATARAQRKTA
jgi:competence protein ComEA